jgi:predicted ATPase/DNA-binding SARP family transcriptional activator
MPPQLANKDIWSIELFGRVRASCASRSIDHFLTRHTAALLALLALSPLGRLPREQIIDVLWPDVDPDSSRPRLSRILGWLRSQLNTDCSSDSDSIIIADRQNVGLDASAFTTDVAQFAELLSKATRDLPAERQIELLMRATALYKGELLPGYYDDWILAKRQYHLGTFLQISHRLANLLEEKQDYESALRCARAAITFDPLEEEAHRDVIRVLTLSGQSSAATRHYQDLERFLRKELNSEPHPATTVLADIARNAKTAAPRPIINPTFSSPQLPPPIKLPVPMTHFFGREPELNQILLMLNSDASRLITLTGTGGSGKTRLAIESARKISPELRRRIVYVPLADIADPTVLVSRMATALGLKNIPSNSPNDQLLDELAQNPYLLVLDNLEHLLPEASIIVASILAESSSTKILATSRQRLGLEGEREIIVQPLDVPPLNASAEDLLTYPCANLLADRIRNVRSTFELSERNAPFVAQLCARLEGLPLAIELCAAWAQTITTAQMVDQLSDRFKLLVSRRSDITPRHRTLRIALEYSYLQLPLELQERFAHLSVFRGGWCLDAAEALFKDLPGEQHKSALTAMTELRERSLIIAEERGDEMRYRLLEALREFASDQLTYAVQREVRNRHASYFAAFAVEAERGLSGPDQAHWLDRLDDEQENIREALAWSVESGELENGMLIGSAIYRFWPMRGHLAEGRDWLCKLLDKSKKNHLGGAAAPDELLLAKTWNTLGYLAWSQSDYAEAISAHEKGLALRKSARDNMGVAESLYHLGITYYRMGELTTARQMLNNSLQISNLQQDRPGIARNLLNLGNISLAERNLDESQTYYEQSYDIERSLGNRKRAADSLNNLGLLARESKNFAQAVRILSDTLAIRQELNDKYGAAIVHCNLASVARRQENWRAAWTHLSTGLQFASDVGNKHILTYYFLEMATLLMRDGNMEDAVYLAASAQSLISSLGMVITSSGLNTYDDLLTTVTNTHAKIYPDAWQSGHEQQSQTISRALSIASTSVQIA